MFARSQAKKNTSNNTEPEVAKFLEKLVIAITGLKIEEIEPAKQDEIITECLQTFKDFIVEYITIRYGEEDANKLTNPHITQTVDIFKTFKTLDQKFDNAYEEFIKTLETIKH